MNIYISKRNEANLRILDESMSGLINKLLDEYFSKEISKGAVETRKIASPKTDKTIFKEVGVIKTKEDAQKAVAHVEVAKEPITYKKTNNWGA